MFQRSVVKRLPTVAWALTAAAALAWVSPAAASISSTPDATYVTDGSVNAIVRSGNSIYLGGYFTQVGPRTGSFVAISPATGQVNAALPQVAGRGGSVHAVMADGAGGWYIGGSFTHVGSVAASDIAHIRPDGTVDMSFLPNADGEIYALARGANGTVYAGGYFSTIGANTQTRNYIAALDPATGSATAWHPYADAPVVALGIGTGGVVYAGGEFTHMGVGGPTRNHIAALDPATGDASSWDPNSTGGPGFGRVNALAVSGNGTVYVGGEFTHIGGANRNYAAALDPTTGIATVWNPGPNFFVDALAVGGDGTVYAGGDFSDGGTPGSTTIGGADRNHIAALDPLNGFATEWNPNANGTVDALALGADGTVYAGGYFSDRVTPGTTIGGADHRNWLAALDPLTGNATAWNPNPNGPVNAVAVGGGAVSAGGMFSSVGGVARSDLAALSAADGRVTAWNPSVGGGVGTGVQALALGADGTVYAGGAFTTIGANARLRNNIAALDPVTGNAIAWNPNANNAIDALAVGADGTVYAGGFFRDEGKPGVTIGGADRNWLAALDPATGNATGWNPNPDSRVEALALGHNGTIYAGGFFATIGANAQPRHSIAALDPATGNATAWSPNASGDVRALAVGADGTVYAGGMFFTIGANTQTRHYIAALEPALPGNASAWNPSASEVVDAIAVGSDGTVYAGGQFLTIGAIPQTRRSLAALDPASGNATAWNPNASGWVFALAPAADGTLYVGGNFPTLDLAAQQTFASFSLPPVSMSTPQVSGTPQAGQLLSCSQGTWSGSTPQSYAYQWLRDGATITGATSASYALTAADAGHQLACRVTASNLGGSASATSAPVSVPAPPAPPSSEAPSSPPPKLSLVGKSNATSNGSSFKASCQASGQLCTGTATLTTTEKLQLPGGKIVGLSARKRQKRVRSRRVVVGSVRFSIPAGQTKTVSVPLNRTGRKLLAKFRRLPVTLAVALNGPNDSPSVVVRSRLTINQQRKKRRNRH
jgi:trimeric autotransporter adhesin